MKDFESQVARAAVRLRDGENGRLSVKPVLRRPRRLSWGWVATPAAAVAGIFIGVGWGRMSGTSMPATAQVWDTVVERRVVYDTVTLVRQEGPAAVQPRSVRRPPSPSFNVGAACRSRRCSRGAHRLLPTRSGGAFWTTEWTIPCFARPCGDVKVAFCHFDSIGARESRRRKAGREAAGKTRVSGRCGDAG